MYSSIYMYVKKIFFFFFLLRKCFSKILTVYNPLNRPAVMEGNVEIMCNYCTNKVRKYVKCMKCDEIFHLSCLNKATCRKPTRCHHETRDEKQRIMQRLTPSKQNTRIFKLRYLEKPKSSNLILIENNKSLNDKIRNLKLLTRTGKLKNKESGASIAPLS